jgi:hypothetical protein
VCGFACLHRFADLTDAFCAGLPSFEAPPPFINLKQLFEAGLRRNGQRIKLPVEDVTCGLMTGRHSRLTELMEPVSITGAYTLSSHITSALNYLPGEPSSELELAGELNHSAACLIA